MSFCIVISTPIGNLALKGEANRLGRIEFLDDRVVPLPERNASPLLPRSVQSIFKKMERYFQSPYDLSGVVPYFLEGSSFQRKVWDCLWRIPLGETRTYGQLAKTLKTSARAIGMACRSNPLPIVIPCHRVVAMHHMGGYCGETAGERLAIKKWLLDHEQRSEVG